MASKSDAQTQIQQSFQVTRAKCGQCGRELRYIPCALNNIMCRDCYGLDRYRRTGAAGWTPEKPVEVALTDEETGTTAV